METPTTVALQDERDDVQGFVGMAPLVRRAPVGAGLGSLGGIGVLAVVVNQR